MLLLLLLLSVWWTFCVVDVSHQYTGVVSSVAQALSQPGTFVLPLLVAVITPRVSVVIVFVCWVAERPSNRLVYLRDGSA